MPNVIKYSTSAQTSALKKGNFWIGTGDVGKGPTSITDYWTAVAPPSGGYTIYLNKATQGPSIFTVTSDAQLISLTNKIANTSYTTRAECLTYFGGQNDKMVLNLSYGTLQTTDLTFCLDAGFTATQSNSSTITDLTSNQYIFNYEGTVSTTTSNGGALYLNGGRIYRDSLGWYGNYTISFWVKMTSVQSGYFYTENYRGDGGCSRIYSTMNGNGSFNYTVWDNSSIGPFGTGSFSVATTTNVQDGNWHQITCVWSNGTSNRPRGIYVFVNGVQEGYADMIGNDGSYSSMHLGGATGCVGTYAFNCYLGPVVQYNNVALSNTQITNLYNAYSSRY
jgi:hypothetical protein